MRPQCRTCGTTLGGASKGDDVRGWVERFVLRLGLCPWAKKSAEKGALFIVTCEASELIRCVILYTGNRDGCADACVVSPPRSSRALTSVYGKRMFTLLKLGSLRFRPLCEDRYLWSLFTHSSSGGVSSHHTSSTVPWYVRSSKGRTVNGAT